MNQSVTQPETDEPRKTPLWRHLLQIIGFFIGISMLVWCIRTAVEGGDFSRLKDAEPRMIAILLGSTVISVIANGTIFWVLIRPVRSLPFLAIQWINGVVNLLNYAPIRLGVITRLTHHRRVDRMTYTHLLAWYAAIAVLMMSTFAALLGATLLRPSVDLIWFAILLTLLAAGGFVIVWISRHHLLTRHLKGAEKMLDHPWKIALCFLLRLVDTGAFATRLYAAFTILGFSLGFKDVVYLTLTSMTANLLPAGSVGVREWAITKFASLLTDEGLQSAAATAALVDRAAEAAIFIPMGIACLFWMLHRWRGTEAPPS